MSTTRHVSEIAGFVESYGEVYDCVRAQQPPPTGDPFILIRAQDVADAFEKKYDVKVSVSDTSAVGDMVFPFDTVDFKTEENLTMCILKWA